LLDLAEEALDEIALAVEGEIGLSGVFAVGFRRDDRRDTARFERFDERVGVVALVGEKGIGLDLIEQRHGLGDVGCLAGRQGQRNGITERIDDGVDLGRQSTARSADGLVRAVFFWAPALCWCARTLVESIDMYSASASIDKISKTRVKTPLMHHRR
jgi:hypothetical protein